MSALAEDADSSGGPSSQPQSGTVLRWDAVLSCDDEPTTKFPQEFARAVLLDHLREFCAAWPDQPHPALNGETPRRRAAAPEGLEQVEALIDEMEQQAQGTPVAEAWNFERLRLELGLAPVLRGVGTTKAR
ncbi:MAG TPA: antitoxin Xre/MbcA/ParS toxin-binding domain-containing protein [Polyangiaceae bacterium]|nr:antitoxin Xre/MbcA/ParS toxin-binding domain-containing protein [Polyangiaceae bacterium]